MDIPRMGFEVFDMITDFVKLDEKGNIVHKHIERLSEESQYTWEIENFREIQDDEPELLALEVTFKAGHIINLPCTWLFTLDSAKLDTDTSKPGGSEGETQWIRLNRKLMSAPDKVTHIRSHCRVEVQYLREKETPIVGTTSSKYDKQMVLGQVASIPFMEKLPNSSNVLIEITNNDSDLLRLTINLTIFGAKEPEPAPKSSGLGQIWDITNFAKWRFDMMRMLEDTATHDVKLISKDGEMMSAHKLILSGRSPVFEKHFKENQGSSRMELFDISSETLKYLLQYFYSGSPDDGWLNPDSIVECTYAAGKYQLIDMLVYLNRMMNKHYEKKTLIQLLKLANRYSLQQAEKELFAELKSCIAKANNYEEVKFLFGEIPKDEN